MTGPICVRCARPLADGAYVCAPEAQGLAETLQTAAGHAEDAETVIARQARYGTGGSGTDEQLVFDPTASARYARFRNTISAWQRAALEEDIRPPLPWRPTTGPLCQPRSPGHHVPWQGHRCPHDSCSGIRDRTPPSPLGEACRWLAGNVEWLRHHPAAGEAFDELTKACEALARLVDRPSTGHRLVGMCDCGKILYAPRGRDVVKCLVCGQRWNVAESQAILLGHLDGKLVTVPEALDMAGWLDVDRSREQIRKLCNKWVERGQVLAHGHVVDGDGNVRATYRFGEIRERLAETPRRAAREAAEMGA